MHTPKLACLTALPLLLGAPALADVPRVAVDIAPIHALVAKVMDGVGVPDLVMPPGASPHGYALRPSEAAVLQGADLVVWVGQELTPWLADPLATLAPDAARLTLLEAEAIRLLDFREGVSFAAHDHGEHDAHDNHGEKDAHDDHAHDDHAHDDHAHDDHAHDDHAHDDHGHDHDHSGTDPHAWLDPVNAGVWLGVIADELSRLDPENAARYASNAQAAQAGLTTLEAEIAARMAELSGQFIVFHDAYHYFEARFGIEAAGAISLSDAAPPGPARVAEIRDLVADQSITCVFAEPQFNRGLVDAVFEGTGVNIGVIDPIGAALTPGAALYDAVLLGMAASFESCLSAD
ncbi:zinc ABC transporter substrate-binding protein [Roseicyclus sp.]|uniref:zinc ABC transporter substrate-binding protein n=1 Tax=Roseicyclus sp. TaxID=1914329 RepID=UPI003F6AC404